MATVWDDVREAQKEINALENAAPIVDEKVQVIGNQTIDDNQNDSVDTLNDTDNQAEGQSQPDDIEYRIAEAKAQARAEIEAELNAAHEQEKNSLVERARTEAAIQANDELERIKAERAADVEALAKYRDSEREAATRLSDADKDDLIEAMGEKAALVYIKNIELANKRAYDIENRLNAQPVAKAPEPSLTIPNGYDVTHDAITSASNKFHEFAKSKNMTWNELLQSEPFKKVSNDPVSQALQKEIFIMDDKGNYRAANVGKASALILRMTELLGVAGASTASRIPQPGQGQQPSKSASNGVNDKAALQKQIDVALAKGDIKKLLELRNSN